LISKRNDFVLDGLATLNVADGFECGHLSVEVHPTQAMKLADECQRDWVIVEIIARNASMSHGEQMSVETADNRDEIYAVLNNVGISGGLLLGGIGTVGGGDSDGHDVLLVCGSSFSRSICGVLN